MKLSCRSLSHRAASGRLAGAAATAALTTPTAALTTPTAALTTTLRSAILVLVVSRLTVMIVTATPSSSGVAIARGELDLELVELVPLLVGALAVGDRLQLLHASAR